MAIGFNLAQPHRVVAANSHYYKTPTEVLYIDRVLPYHDLIYLVDGGWMITENGVDYPLEKGDVLLLAAGRHHYTRLPSLPETRTICIHITCEPGDDENEAGTLIISPPRIFAKKHIFNRPEQFWVMDDKVRGRRFVL